MSLLDFSRNDTAFKGYTVPKERGADFMRMLRAEREANRLFHEYAAAPVVTELDPENNDDFLEIYPIRVETY